MFFSSHRENKSSPWDYDTNWKVAVAGLFTSRNHNLTSPHLVFGRHVRQEIVLYFLCYCDMYCSHMKFCRLELEG